MFNNNIQLNQSLANHLVSAAVNLTTEGSDAQAKTNGVRHDQVRQEAQNKQTKELATKKTRTVTGLQARFNVEDGLENVETHLQEEGQFRPMYFMPYYYLDVEA